MKALIFILALVTVTASAQFTHDEWFGGKTEDEEAAIRALVRRIAPTVEPSLEDSKQLEFFLNSSVPGMDSSIRIHSILSLMVLADTLEQKMSGGGGAAYHAVDHFKTYVSKSKKKGYSGVESILASMSGGRGLQVSDGRMLIGDPVTTVNEVTTAINAAQDAYDLLQAELFVLNFLKGTATLEDIYDVIPSGVFSSTDLVFETIDAGISYVENFDNVAVGTHVLSFAAAWNLRDVTLEGDTIVVSGTPELNADGWFTGVTPVPLGSANNSFWRVVELMLRVKSIYGNEDYQKQFGKFITALGSSGVVQPKFNSDGISTNYEHWSAARDSTHDVFLDLGQGGNTKCKQVKVWLIPDVKTEATRIIHDIASISTPNGEISFPLTAIGAAQTSSGYTLQATLIYDKLDGDGDPLGKFSVTITQPIWIQNASLPITKANLPPVARPVTVEVDSSGTVNIPLDVFDPDGSISSISVVSRPLHSVKRIPASPDWQDDFKGFFSQALKLRYKHDGSATTTDTFTYTVTDDKGATSSPATVTINILVSPTAPAIVTYPQTKQVEVGRSVAIRLSGSSSTDAPLTYTITATPSAGQLTQPASSSPKIQIYKAPISPGVQTIGYRVQDNLGNSKNEIVTINVVAASEQAPLATNVPVSVRAGGTTSFKLLASDADGGALAYQVTSNPSRGVVTGTPPNLTYAHDPASGLGSDSLTWQVTDLTGRTAYAHAVFTVTNSEPVIAPLSNRTAIIGQPVIVGLRATDADSHPIEFALESGSPGSIDGSNQWSHTFNTPGAYTVTVLASDRAAAGGAILSTVRSSFTVVVGGYTEFIDVPPSHPHFVTITDAARTRGFVGYPSGSDREFRPDQAITRGEFMTLVMRFTGTPVDTSGTLFPDVPSTHTHFAAIQTYKNQAFVVGYGDGTFRPDSPLARQEMAIIFANLAGWDDDEPVTSVPFADVPAAPPNGLTNSQWTPIYQSVGQLVRHSLASTANTNYRPFDNATRLEAVLMLSRFSNFDSQISIPNDGAYSNVNVTSDWSIRTFSILNEGTTAIQLTGSPAVTITGSAAADYTVVAQPAINIAAGAVVSFKVSFDPSTTGSRPASLIIPTNSSILGTITIPLSGTGVSYTETVLNTTNQTFDYSGTHSGSITLQNGTLRLLSDLTISGTLKLKGGALNLNGFNLTVGQDMEIGLSVTLANGKKIQITGDVIHSAGTLDLNGGRLEIGGSYYMQRDLNGTGVLNTYSNGNLVMDGAADYMLVNGDVVIDNLDSTFSNLLSAGTLEVRGNFSQKSIATAASAYDNFRPSGTHRVLLSGSGVQAVFFEDPAVSSSYSMFNILEVANSGLVDLRTVVIFSKLVGSFHQVGSVTTGALGGGTLDSDVLITGNCRLVSLNLNGRFLSVTGDVIHSDGTLDLNGGRLEIGGSYYMQRDLNGTGVLNTYSNGNLVMDGAADYMLVNGDVVIDNLDSTFSNLLSAGTLEVRGNFSQKSIATAASAYDNFRPSGTHRVLLSGSGVQAVFFEDPAVSSSYSMFNILEVANSGLVDLRTVVIFSKLVGSFHQVGSVTTGALGGGTLDSDVLITGNCRLVSLNLNGRFLSVTGDVIHSDGTLDLNGGRLEIGGSYYMQRDLNGTGVLNTYSNGNLVMDGAADYMLVNGDVVIDNLDSTFSNLLSAGTLEVRGNFSQKSIATAASAYDNFRPSGTHRVLLSGSGVQAVFFEDPAVSSSYSMFNILEIANSGLVDLRTVVIFSKLVGSFHQVGSVTAGALGGGVLDSDVLITGNCRLVSLNLNGRLLSITGDVIHSDGTLDLNGGRLEIGGSYYMQRDLNGTGVLNTFSNGNLVMDGAADYMLVKGDVIIDNYDSTYGNLLSAGTLEVRGNFSQRSIASYAGAYDNFRPSGTHRVLLSGSGVQAVFFEDPAVSSSYSMFNILEIGPAASTACLTRTIVGKLLRHNQRPFTLFASALTTDFPDFDLDGMRDHQDPWPEDATNPGGFVTLSPETISKSDSAQSYSVGVNSNILWTQGGTLPAWMTVTPSSGIGNGTLTVTLQANPGAVARTGSFTVNGQTHTVTQDLNAAVAALPGALDLPGAQLTMGGNASWFSDASASPVTGSSAGASGLITHGQQTWMEMTVTGPVVLGFWWKVSSEATYDKLQLAVDGTVITSISGTVAWTKKEHTIAAGSHVVRWTYLKDGSASVGSDRGWVDGVTLTPIAPEIAVEQPAGTDLTSGTSSIGYGTVAIGTTVDRVFTIKNTGNTDLTLSGTPKVAVSGPDAAMFTVITQPTSPVVMTGSTTFTVRFTPSSIGAKTVAISIANNDADEGTFNLTLTGTGTSTDATLSNLALSSGTLTPAFASGIFSYTATVPNSTTTTTLTPTVAESNAVVTVNGMAVASGNASDTIALSVGLNTLTTVVTAQDGITTKTYTIHVTRSPLPPTVSSPTFTGVTASSALLGGNVISDGGGGITARGVVLAASSVNNNPLIGGLGVMNVIGTGTTGVFAVAVSSLAPGTAYSFAAYATNSEGTSYSNVGAFSTPSNNASLASLTLSTGTMSPVFASGTANYTLTVPNGTLSVTAVPTTAESHALVSINGTDVASGNVSDSISLGAGPTIITTLVTAQDGTTTTYTVTVVKPGTLALANTTFTVTSGTLATTADIVIHRTGGSGGTVGGLLSTSNGTAISPAQFTAQTNSPFSLANAQIVQHVLIPIAANATTTTAKTFTVTLSGANGGGDLGSPLSATVIILPPSATTDTTKPTVTITTPASKASLNDNTPVIIAGIAKDNIAVSKVQVSLDNGASFNEAVLTSPETASTNYSFAMTPVTGLNAVQVRSIDFKGNISTVVATSFTQLRTLAVAVNGPPNSGTVTAGFAPSSSRQVGKSYTITATPKTGYVFDGWTVNDSTGTGISIVTAELPALTFTMQENLALTAKFILNPFTTALVGTFNGLALPSASLPAPSGTTPGVANVGLLNLVLGTKGAFTGSLKIDGASLSTPGFFDNAGVARFSATTRATTLLLKRTGKPDIELALNLNMTPGSGKLTGTVTQKLVSVVQAVSNIDADRAHYSTANKVPANLAGTATKPYTLIFPAKTQSPAKPLNTYPQGDGYATMTVNVNGTVSLTGKLADDTPITASAPLSKLNLWPIFAQLYTMKGSIAGMAALTDANGTTEDVIGTNLQWFRPALTGVQYYPAGWPGGITVDVNGARYVVPPASPATSVFPGLSAMNPTTGNATLTFTGGLLNPLPLPYNINISTANLVTNAPVASSPTMLIDKASGKITGAFIHTDGPTIKPAYQGVIIQKGTRKGGSGYFMSRATPVTGLGESGRVQVLAK